MGISASRSLGLFDLFDYLDIEVWLYRTGGFLGPGHDCLSNRRKDLLHSNTQFGTGFNVLQIMLLCKVRNFFAHHFPPLEDIAFGADKHHRATRRRLLFDLPQPVLQLFEAFEAIQRKNNNDAFSASIVGFCDGMKALLAGGVPDLQMRVSTLNEDLLLLEVDADSTNVCFVKLVAHKSTDQGSLSDPRITNHQYLDFLLLLISVQTHSFLFTCPFHQYFIQFQ